jgi:hypothetical protein
LGDDVVYFRVSGERCIHHRRDKDDDTRGGAKTMSNVVDLRTYKTEKIVKDIERLIDSIPEAPPRQVSSEVYHLLSNLMILSQSRSFEEALERALDDLDEKQRKRSQIFFSGDPIPTS